MTMQVRFVGLRGGTARLDPAIRRVRRFARYLQAHSAYVAVQRAGHDHVARLGLQLPDGLNLRAEATGPDPLSALDDALSTLEMELGLLDEQAFEPDGPLAYPRALTGRGRPDHRPSM